MNPYAAEKSVVAAVGNSGSNRNDNTQWTMKGTANETAPGSYPGAAFWWCPRLQLTFCLYIVKGNGSYSKTLERRRMIESMRAL